MRLLDRYLLKELVVPLCYCLVGFLIFWISFHLFSELNQFQKAKLQPWDILQYYIVTLPELLVVVLPIALLLALLYTLTNHARHNEITAMQAAGISLWRIGAPYLVVGFVSSLVLFFVSEWWMTESTDKANEIMQRHVPLPTNSLGADHIQLFFRNELENRNWTAPSYNLRTAEMVKPTIIWLKPDGSRLEIYAERATFNEGTWSFFDVTQDIYSTEEGRSRSQTNHLVITDFEETPGMIRSELKINNLKSVQAAKRAMLSIRDILTYLKVHPRLSETHHALLYTQLHGRFSMPWSCLTVVLVALPFAARSGRRNVFVGVASSITICFVYFVLQRLGLTLGTGGHLPPWLAAWLPNLFFASTGIYLTFKSS